MDSQQIGGAVNDNKSICCKEETSVICICSFAVPERKTFFPDLGITTYACKILQYIVKNLINHEIRKKESQYNKKSTSLNYDLKTT